MIKSEFFKYGLICLNTVTMQLNGHTTPSTVIQFNSKFKAFKHVLGLINSFKEDGKEYQKELATYFLLVDVERNEYRFCLDSSYQKLYLIDKFGKVLQLGYIN